MKKIIAVLIALAMVLSMSVMAFAVCNNVKSPLDVLEDNNVVESEYEKYWNSSVTLTPEQIEDWANWWEYVNIYKAIKEQPIYVGEDGKLMRWSDAWLAYTNYVASQLKSNPQEAATELVAIAQGGYVPAGDVISIVGNSIMGGIGGDGNEGDLSGVISGIIDKITGGDKEPEVTAEQYADELAELINSGATADEITSKISDDLANGKIVVNQIPDIVKAISAKVEAGEIENNETVQKILDFFKGFGGDSDSPFPDFGEITLPWDNGNSENGSFLDTILGIIGSIGDIFNPTPDEPTTPDDPSEPGNTDPIPDTGDVSFVAVAAVAAVAGVAFVLTRKKSDAE